MRRDEGDPRVALEVGRVEGEEAADAVDDHGGHQPGVVGLLTADLVGDDELLPGREERGVSFRTVKSVLSSASSAWAGAGVRPMPFWAAGRVTTTQNS